MTQQLPVQTLQPMIRVLSDEQVQAIHNATLEILEKHAVPPLSEETKAVIAEVLAERAAAG